MSRRRALFLDRDGTLVYPFHYPSRPEHLRLYENIGPGLRALQEMDFALIMITNQSGVARGYFSEAELQGLHDYLRTQLAKLGVHLDAIYHCPHHPEGIIPELAVRCDCRKPRPGMLLRAASDLDLDLQQSWFVGDILDDVEAGHHAGCHTILVDIGSERFPTTPERVPTFVARNTIHALDIIKTVVSLQSEVDLLYQPASWQKRDPESARHLAPSVEVQPCK